MEKKRSATKKLPAPGASQPTAEKPMLRAHKRIVTQAEHAAMEMLAQQRALGQQAEAARAEAGK